MAFRYPGNIQQGRRRHDPSQGWRPSDESRLRRRVGDFLDIRRPWVLAFIPRLNIIEYFLRNSLETVVICVHVCVATYSRKATLQVATHRSRKIMHSHVRLCVVWAILCPSKPPSMLLLSNNPSNSKQKRLYRPGNVLGVLSSFGKFDLQIWASRDMIVRWGLPNASKDARRCPTITKSVGSRR